MITDFILTGKSQAISLSELARVTGMPERSVKQEVLEARLQGHLIVSDESGYYFPETETDLREYVSARRAVIRTSSKALKPFIQALRG